MSERLYRWLPMRCHSLSRSRRVEGFLDLSLSHVPESVRRLLCAVVSVRGVAFEWTRGTLKHFQSSNVVKTRLLRRLRHTADL